MPHWGLFEKLLNYLIVNPISNSVILAAYAGSRKDYKHTYTVEYNAPFLNRLKEVNINLIYCDRNDASLEINLAKLL